MQPNLLMYEVAKREDRDDADKYFDAAFKQVEWMIANLGTLSGRNPEVAMHKAHKQILRSPIPTEHRRNCK